MEWPGKASYFLLCISLLIVNPTFSQNITADADFSSSDTARASAFNKISYHGSVSMENGEVEKCQYTQYALPLEYEHLWTSRNSLKLKTFVEVNQSIRIAAGITSKLWFDNFPSQMFLGREKDADICILIPTQISYVKVPQAKFRLIFTTKKPPVS